VSRDRALADHCHEMVRRCSGTYRMFGWWEEADPSVHVGEAAQRELALLVEAMLAAGLSMQPEGRDVIARIARLEHVDAATALAAWRHSLQAAHVSRRSMQLILTGLGEWLEVSSPMARRPFLEVLPQLAPQLQGLGDSGMLRIVQAASSLSEDRCEFLLRSIGHYGGTSAEIILGVCRIGLAALQWGKEECLDLLLQTVPESSTGKSRDAQRLIPELADLSDMCGQYGEACWDPAVNVVLVLSSTNVSSGWFAARELRKKAAVMPPETLIPYLESFLKLATAIGIRIVGFGTKTLPTLYEEHGPDRTGAFVEAAALAATRYGITAGQWFCEQRTGPAREMLKAP
jgi:hypothetical protein